MRRLAVVVAAVSGLVLSVFAAGGLAANAADPSPSGGAMICDGLTGCYIIPVGDPAWTGAWLGDCTSPTDFRSGPILCTRQLTVFTSASQITVNTEVDCAVFERTGAGHETVLVYESTHGAIIVRQSGTTVSL